MLQRGLEINKVIKGVYKRKEGKKMKGINNVRDLLERMEEHKGVVLMDEWGDDLTNYNSVKEALETDDLYLYASVDGFSDSMDKVEVWAICRRCSECGKPMIEGYLVGDGDAYYCSTECLHKHYTDEEWDEMFANDDGYYTTWY